MKRTPQGFWVGTGAALLWMGASAFLCAPWLGDLTRNLPTAYAVFAVAGIALLPGYLTMSMWISNLINAARPPLCAPYAEPVTVLICARDEEKSIYATLEAVARQTYAGEIRILCVDNGSGDGTRAEVLRAISGLRRENRSIELEQCEQPGKARALNRGLSRVRTRYFVTVDADTILQKDALDVIVRRIAHSGAACVAGNLAVKDARGWVSKMQIYDYLLSIAAIKRFQGACGSTLVAQGAFSAYEREAVLAVGGWTQCAGEDIVLTYRLLALGKQSLYEARAAALTLAPDKLGALCRQRTRWARGMFDGLRAVAPWRQASLYAGYFEALNASIVYLDLAYVFGFLAGVILCALGYDWLVGKMTLLVLPAFFAQNLTVYIYQRNLAAFPIRNSLWGGILFVLFFQAIQSVCSLAGYAQALLGKKLRWK